METLVTSPGFWSSVPLLWLARSSIFLLLFCRSLLYVLDARTKLCLLLLEKSVYSDEAYLFALVGLLLSFTDCGKTLGLEAPSLEEEEARARGISGGRGGATRNQPPDTVPHWHVVLLRFQVRDRQTDEELFETI